MRMSVTALESRALLLKWFINSLYPFLVMMLQSVCPEEQYDLGCIHDRPGTPMWPPPSLGMACIGVRWGHQTHVIALGCIGVHL